MESYKKKEEDKLGDVVSKVMRAMGYESKMKELDIIRAWPELMGEGVAYRTTKIYIKNKTLYLHFNSSVIRDELQMGKSVIIERVNQFAGKEVINDIWFG